jgi:uncharacterized protein (TIGR03067 family)
MAMDRRTLLSAMTASALAGCGLFPKPKNPLEGVWAVDSATMSGAALPLTAFQDAKLSLDAGLYEFQTDRGDYVVLPGTTPIAIDIHGRDGPNAGRTILGIYELNGDTLTICYDLSGKDRPKKFVSTAGTQLFLVRYKRLQ